MPALTWERAAALMLAFLAAQAWNDLRKRVANMEREKLSPSALDVVLNELKHLRDELKELKEDFKGCAGCKVAE